MTDVFLSNIVDRDWCKSVLVVGGSDALDQSGLGPMSVVTNGESRGYHLMAASSTLPTSF